MARSTLSKLVANLNRNYYFEDLLGKEHFPYKAGEKSATHSNASRTRQTRPEAREVKSPQQLEREQAYLGRNGHQRSAKPATHKHGGDGTIRRSSQRKAFRGIRRFEDVSV